MIGQTCYYVVKTLVIETVWLPTQCLASVRLFYRLNTNYLLCVPCRGSYVEFVVWFRRISLRICLIHLKQRKKTLVITTAM